jgi:protein involved in polysaccharide export with SLBB domain
MLMDMKTLFFRGAGVWLALMGAFFWSVVATPAQSNRDFVRTIMPGDRLRITVEEQPDLNRVYAVAGDGTIDVGLLGRTRIADMTAAGAADYIEGRLEEGFFRQATVQVEVAEFVEGNIMITGAIAEPGTISFSGDQIMTVSEAIISRGGLSRNAAGTEVKIIRWKPGGTMEREILTVDVQSMLEDFDFTQDQYLRPRDLIVVPSLGEGAARANEFLALGEFGSSGFHPWSPNLDMVRAVTRAGGISREGILTAARILRQDPETGTFNAIPIDLSLLFGAADMSMNVPVMAGDIIFVPSSQQATRGTVYMLGEVAQVGAVSLPMNQEATLAKTILSSGGFARFANEGRVQVLRTDPDGTKQTLQVDVGRILKTGAFEDDVPLMDGDVIIVPERLLTF